MNKNGVSANWAACCPDPIMHFFLSRNLAAIQDREICCYSISCKEKDNIGELQFESFVLSHLNSKVAVFSDFSCLFNSQSWLREEAQAQCHNTKMYPLIHQCKWDFKPILILGALIQHNVRVACTVYLKNWKCLDCSDCTFSFFLDITLQWLIHHSKSRRSWKFSSLPLSFYDNVQTPACAVHCTVQFLFCFFFIVFFCHSPYSRIAKVASRPKKAISFWL